MPTPYAALAGALILGMLQGLAFAPAPFPAWFLPVVQLATFGGMSWLTWRAATLRHAIWIGAAFGGGTFLVGVSWIYISLHVYAFMAAPLAAMGVGLLAAYLSLYPALATGTAWWLAQRPAATDGPARLASPLTCVLAMAAAWTGSEWLRGVLFTGFPWLNIGYAHVDSPLQGWAPLLGVYGVAFTAALTASGWSGRPEPWPNAAPPASRQRCARGGGHPRRPWPRWSSAWRARPGTGYAPMARR